MCNFKMLKHISSLSPEDISNPEIINQEIDLGFMHCKMHCKQKDTYMLY